MEDMIKDYTAYLKTNTSSEVTILWIPRSIKTPQTKASEALASS